ncbi:DUF47 domain-containing protein [Parvibium lacunae]|uniref:DUF47 domain-containing protein n=1 Tax=Parvibium lacunae TaxID=1888893 RepID=A0A368L6X7_9BURK|nr:DUF47 domain-containing protein [Parvibium lacunae]RCS59377.1 DUF47 domain-containing protein [Parvibium lacunae]
MFGKFMPTEGQFFGYFNEHAEHIIAGSKALVALLDDFDQLEAQAQVLNDHEHAADRITHATIDLLHKTFITPLDRDQIHSLINSMDDILDLMQDVVESISLYDVKRITPEAKQLGNICLACAERVKTVVGSLSDMHDSQGILKICHEIDRLESDADRVMRSAMSKLFRHENDVRELIKMKAIYELLEAVTDRCEDVANIIEGIVLEHS